MGEAMNAYGVVRDFEKELCDYTRAPYCVTVESCSAALFLCCLHEKVREIKEVSIPKITYPSAACAIINAGGRIAWNDENWQEYGAYVFNGTNIVDSAKRLCRGMYKQKDSLHCLSFHAKKHLSIGRGGAILTDSKEAYDWFRWMRFDGRNETSLPNDTLMGVGWNLYMTPSQAARGLELMQWLKDVNIGTVDEYQDLSKYKFYTEANR